MNKSKQWLKMCIKIAEYFDKNGFPEDLDTGRQADHLTIEFDNRYIIDVRRKTHIQDGSS